MMRNKLYFYRNRAEFDQYYNDNNGNISGFEILDSKGILDDVQDTIIDITDLILYVRQESLHRYSVRLSLNKLDASTKLIINYQYVNEALNIFPLIFDEALPLYDKEEEIKILEKNIRHKIYYYNDFQFSEIENECNKNKIILTNFANLPSVKDYENELIIDITSTLQSMKGAEHIIYLLEQFFSTMSKKTKVIVNVDKLDEVKKYLKLTFSEYLDISKLLTNISEAQLPSVDPNKLRRIIDLTEDELSNLLSSIEKKLVGHSKFKNNLKDDLKKFLTLNKLKKRKIFSLFLLGKPGLGKTEIGRIISKTINPDSKIIKINFGNYSSQDALNSLIGSPAGYIGCDGGELSKKISKNPVGVIICDEFEKSDSEIKNFFLELLEDGKFTDSMGREYNLDGYIIVFTSNINDENEFNSKMSPEFKSRINLICEFTPLDDEDKLKYINYQIQEFKENIDTNSIKHKKIPEEIDINYQDTDDLRELRDRVYNKLMEYID